jgi:hypothetical protein
MGFSSEAGFLPFEGWLFRRNWWCGWRLYLDAGIQEKACRLDIKDVVSTRERSFYGFLFHKHGILLKKWDTSLDIAKQFEKQYDNQVRYAKDTSLVTSPIPHSQPHSDYFSLEQGKWG